MLPPAAEPDVPSPASWCSCHASGDRRGPSGASLVAEQIAAWLRRTYPGDLEMRVSHDTIYLSLFVQTRGALRRDAALRYNRPSSLSAGPALDTLDLSLHSRSQHKRDDLTGRCLP